MPKLPNLENIKFSKIAINLETQKDYINFHNQVDSEEYTDKEVLVMGKKLLTDKNHKTKEIKKTLLLLAHLENIQALHIIDRYLTIVPQALKDWVILAYKECLTSLEGELKGEDQMMITTGLGGRNNMMRYYFVLSSRDKSNFTKNQKEIIEKSLKKVCATKNSEIEKIEFKNNYALIQALTSFNIAVGDFIETSINECNKIGNNFLIFHYLINNTWKPREEEISKYLKEIK